MYHETSNTIEIISRLKSILKEHPALRAMDDVSNLDEATKLGILWPFAEIDTNRKEYQLKEDKLDVINDANKDKRMQYRSYKLGIYGRRGRNTGWNPRRS